jgi:hypothetical protein
MGTRSNACSELTRFWLQARHNCLVDESVPVAVPYALSDIDFLVIRPDLGRFSLPNGALVGPRLIVETKDEHDWDPSGKIFGADLRTDVAMMNEVSYIPNGAKGVKFSMLRQQHYEKAAELFDRLFVVHALDPQVRAEMAPGLVDRRRIHLVTIRELVGDLMPWYKAHLRPAGLRHSLIGDLLHLLVGYCRLDIASTDSE